MMMLLDDPRASSAYLWTESLLRSALHHELLSAYLFTF